jgi:hypothetical protein
VVAADESSVPRAGATIYVDNGMNCMGLAMDSQALARKEEPVTA